MASCIYQILNCKVIAATVRSSENTFGVRLHKAIGPSRLSKMGIAFFSTTSRS